MALEELRLLALGDSADESADEILQLLQTTAERRLLFAIGLIRRGFGLSETVEVVPSELSWIIDDLVIKRWNRIGSEGYRSEAVEGHRIEFSSDDLKEYLGYLSDFYRPDDYGGSSSGRVVFW